MKLMIKGVNTMVAKMIAEMNENKKIVKVF